MHKKERVAYIQQRLQEIYPETPIPLDHEDAYTLLIAVLLSAQCTDKRVNEVTPHLFVRANTPQAMVQVAVEEIREIIKPCGLSPRKSQAIFNLSRLVLEQHAGKVPDNFADLEALPVVGRLAGRDRYSMGMFFDPNIEAVVRCLDGFAGDATAAKHAPIRYGDYFRHRLDSNYPDRVGVSAAMG